GRAQPAERDALPGEPAPAALSDSQQATLARIVDQLDAGESANFLLYGATGSGKTEVYLQACAAALERGRGAIVLVPEIALTPQALGRFRARFGERIAVLHSALTEAERRDGSAAARRSCCSIAGESHRRSTAAPAARRCVARTAMSRSCCTPTACCAATTAATRSLSPRRAPCAVRRRSCASAPARSGSSASSRRSSPNWSAFVWMPTRSSGRARSPRRYAASP